MRSTDFRLLWIGQAVSELGSRGYGVAIMLWVLAASGSPAQVGMVSTAALVCFAAASVPGGWAVDRFDRRRVMLACDAAAAASAASLAWSAWTGAFGLPQVLAAACVLGVAWSVRGLAEDAAVPQLVAAHELPRAVALVEGRGYATGVAGPPLAAALYGVSPAIPFATQAFAFLCAGGSAALVKRPLQQPRHPASERSPLWAGVPFWWRHPFLRASSLLGAAGVFVINAAGLVLVVALTRADLPTAAVGGALAAAYAGGVAGSALAPALRRRADNHALLVAAAAAGALALPVVAFGSPAWAVAGYAALMAAQPVWQVVVTAKQIEVMPDEVRGRVSGVLGLAATVPALAAPVCCGLLVARFGVGTAGLALTALLGAAAAATAFNTAMRGALRGRARTERSADASGAPVRA
jgi:predicted MFS family arabinose efflux permease